ncbi:BIG1-domain-containing protein [Xylariomycetidae sp. FL2044]|nr:BIG1-domain-containing protein [Xylariomycetidae sp. FL2044]
MRLFVTATLAAFCASAQAFSDSSPFLVLSTAKLPSLASEEQLQSSSRVLSTTQELLASCPTERYLLAFQPNVNAEHLRQPSAVPRLRRSLGQAQGRYSVAEVIGDVEVESLLSLIREACEGRNPQISEVNLDPLVSGRAAAKTLKENDDVMGMFLDEFDAEGSYTLIYTGVSSRTDDSETYEPEFQDSVHTELKRQLRPSKRQSDKDTRPLFEKYQYFTPGIFMGLIALIVLLSILYVGISAVASLEVPYGAFDKEMGPAAQKKQQ